MKDFFKSVLANLVALILYSFVFFILFAGIAGVVAAFGDKSEPVKSNSVLHLSFKSEITDRANDGFSLTSLTSGLQQGVGLNDILECIGRAKTDDNIKCIFIDNSDIPANWQPLTKFAKLWLISKRVENLFTLMPTICRKAFTIWPALPTKSD